MYVEEYPELGTRQIALKMQNVSCKTKNVARYPEETLSIETSNLRIIHEINICSFDIRISHLDNTV